MEETGVPGKNHRPVASYWQALSLNVVSSTPLMSGIRIYNISGDIYIDTDCIGSYKPNYNTIMTATAH